MKKAFGIIFLIASCISTLISVFNFFGNNAVAAFIALIISIIGIIISVKILEKSRQNHKSKQDEENTIFIVLTIVGCLTLTCCLLRGGFLPTSHKNKVKENTLQTSQTQEITKPATVPVTEKVIKPEETTTIETTTTVKTSTAATTTLATTTVTTIITTIVTEPPAEPPTEPPTPAPTSPPTDPPPPPEPVIAESDYVLNTSTMKAHYPSCRDVDRMDPENRWDYYGTVEDIQSMGYSSCGHCYPW